MMLMMWSRLVLVTHTPGGTWTTDASFTSSRPVHYLTIGRPRTYASRLATQVTPAPVQARRQPTADQQARGLFGFEGPRTLQTKRSGRSKRCTLCSYTSVSSCSCKRHPGIRRSCCRFAFHYIQHYDQRGVRKLGRNVIKQCYKEHLLISVFIGLVPDNRILEAAAERQSSDASSSSDLLVRLVRFSSSLDFGRTTRRLHIAANLEHCGRSVQAKREVLYA